MIDPAIKGRNEKNYKTFSNINDLKVIKIMALNRETLPVMRCHLKHHRLDSDALRTHLISFQGG
jgi:hypothetical protein